MQNDIEKLELFEKVPELGSGVWAAAVAARPAIRTTFTPFNIRRYGNSLDYSELERTSVYRLQCVHTSPVSYGSERNECSAARLALRALVI